MRVLMCLPVVWMSKGGLWWERDVVALGVGPVGKSIAQPIMILRQVHGLLRRRIIMTRNVVKRRKDSNRRIIVLVDIQDTVGHAGKRRAFGRVDIVKL